MLQLNYFKSYWSFNGFIKSYMLGSHIYYKNPFSAWQISGYDTEFPMAYTIWTTTKEMKLPWQL